MADVNLETFFAALRYVIAPGHTPAERMERVEACIKDFFADAVIEEKHYGRDKKVALRGVVGEFIESETGLWSSFERWLRRKGHVDEAGNGRGAFSVVSSERRHALAVAKRRSAISKASSDRIVEVVSPLERG